ncbi:hypothetical protein GT755_19670 [Herbidospora sp. NEAU-GS84]|uniref:Uncharacterized protein n=1 Tax=Herbidospora solisilvae TaxID=2696284 RepID=A0A7C9JCU0_9ACTN|nr:hypothetical protein [Herbidospora solisilvae]NAS23904.1 hypothetical protein [Herbidospora solisilvae]
MGTTEKAGGGMRQNLSSATGTVKAAPGAARRTVRGNPMAAGLIAFGAGALAAVLIPQTIAERRTARQVEEQVGEYVEPVVTALKESAQTLGKEAGSTARDAVQHVKESAPDAAQGARRGADLPVKRPALEEAPGPGGDRAGAELRNRPAPPTGDPEELFPVRSRWAGPLGNTVRTHTSGARRQGRRFAQPFGAMAPHIPSRRTSDG